VDSFVNVQDFLNFTTIDSWSDGGLVDSTKVCEKVELVIFCSHSKVLNEDAQKAGVVFTVFQIQNIFFLVA